MLRDDRLRWAAPILRAVFLAVAALIGYIATVVGRDDDTVVDDTSGFALATTALAITGLLASLRPPGRTSAIVQPIGEAAVVGMLIVTVGGELGSLYAGYLFIPTFVAGQRADLPGSLAATVFGAGPWLVEVLATGGWQGYVEGMDDRLSTAVLVLGALAAISLLSAWIRRLRTEREVTDENAYADAFRLLSELQHVARNLSLGLDPATLARALVEDLDREVPQSRHAVAVRGPEGRFAPLVGSLDDEAQVVASQTWLSGEPSERESPGGHSIAFPVRMGERVVAVTTLFGTVLTDEERARAEHCLHEAGPRLAAALLFDQVRQLATNDERLRLAREIHDGIAQELASIGYLLDDLTGRVPAEAATDLAGLRDHVRRVTGDLRLSIFDLRAGVDDEVTLGAALAEHVQRVAAASRLVTQTTFDEQGARLSAGTEIELLRIAQEALTNVRKHARARTVWIECRVDAPDALLRVADDGVGLGPVRPGAMGLRGMRERARRIDGRLVVGERAGGGTVVEVRLGEPRWTEEPLARTPTPAGTTSGGTDGDGPATRVPSVA